MSYKTNYHTHSVFCDGKNTPKEIIEAALHKEFTDLGFSSHALYPFASTWHLPINDFKKYFSELTHLQKEYSTQINIFIGLEVDFFPLLSSFPNKNNFSSFNLDYMIGSLHFLSTDEKLPCFTVDGSAQEVVNGISTHFNGNAKKFVQAYYQNLRKMIVECDFDIIGHVDVILKRNHVLQFVDTSEKWYKKEIELTAQVIASTNKIVEINTGGMTRQAINTTYPSQDFLRYLCLNKVPIVINSDAHKAQDIDGYYDVAKENAINAGYKSVSVLQKNNQSVYWKQIDIHIFEKQMHNGG
ncbi:MAG: histidinol-phosphatase [Treponemataceae bacterium]